MRLFQWCLWSFGLTSPCQKLKKLWKGLIRVALYLQTTIFLIETVVAYGYSGTTVKISSIHKEDKIPEYLRILKELQA